MSTTHVLGHDIEIEDADDGAVVTDVVILTRHVRHTDEGKLEDSVGIWNSHTTTGIIQVGMIRAASDICAYEG